MQVVQFKKRMVPYNSGDIAGFPDDRAKLFVNRGFAEPVVDKRVEVVINRQAEPVVDKQAKSRFRK